MISGRLAITRNVYPSVILFGPVFVLSLCNFGVQVPCTGRVPLPRRYVDLQGPLLPGLARPARNMWMINVIPVVLINMLHFILRIKLFARAFTHVDALPERKDYRFNATLPFAVRLLGVRTSFAHVGASAFRVINYLVAFLTPSVRHTNSPVLSFYIETTRFWFFAIVRST